jgi:hypothetical protein
MKTNEEIHKIVQQKIKEYQPKNGLDSVSLFLLNLSQAKHPEVKYHIERVALLSESTAKICDIESKSSFFAGLFHDIGKIVLPYHLFKSDVIISPEEYSEIKTHALEGFKILQEQYMFTSLCAGAHHAMYENGYGLSLSEFPSNIGLATAKKILDISMIVSIADFVDAFCHRKTKILDGSDKSDNLKDMLENKYPNDKKMVQYVLNAFKKLEI